MNSSSHEKLKLKRESLDNWTTREQLCLASSVLKSGDKNWASVSRSLKPFAEKDASRPPDWFSQKSCAIQYSLLLETADTPKRKKRDSGETACESVVKRLTQERIAELNQLLASQKEEYKQIKSEINLLKSGTLNEEKLQKMWQVIEQEEKEQDLKVKNQTNWVAKRQQKQEIITSQPTTPVTTPKKVVEMNNDFQEPESGSNDLIEEKKIIGQSELLTTLLKSQGSTIQHQIVSSIGTSTIQTTTPSIVNRLTSSTKITSIPQTTQTISSQFHQLVTSAMSSGNTERPSAGAPTLSMLLSQPANLARNNLTIQNSTEESAPRVSKPIDQPNVPAINTPVADVTPKISETESILPIIDPNDKDEVTLMLGDIEEFIQKEILNPTEPIPPQTLIPAVVPVPAPVPTPAPVPVPPITTPTIIETLPIVPEKPVVIEEPIDPPQVIEPVPSPSDSSHEMAIEEIDQSTSNIAEIIGAPIDPPALKVPEEPKIETQSEEKNEKIPGECEDKKLDDEPVPMEIEPSVEPITEDSGEQIHVPEENKEENVVEKTDDSQKNDKKEEETTEPVNDESKNEVEIINDKEIEDSKKDVAPEESEKEITAPEPTKEAEPEIKIKEVKEQEQEEEVNIVEIIEKAILNEDKQPELEDEKNDEVPDQKTEKIIDEIPIKNEEEEQQQEKELIPDQEPCKEIDEEKEKEVKKENEDQIPEDVKENEKEQPVELPDEKSMKVDESQAEKNIEEVEIKENKVEKKEDDEEVKTIKAIEVIKIEKMEEIEEVKEIEKFKEDEDVNEMKEVKEIIEVKIEENKIEKIEEIKEIKEEKMDEIELEVKEIKVKEIKVEDIKDDVTEIKTEKVEIEKKTEEKTVENTEVTEKNLEPPEIEQHIEILPEEKSDDPKENENLEFKEEPPVLIKMEDTNENLDNESSNLPAEPEIEPMSKDEAVEVIKLEENDDKQEKKDEIQEEVHQPVDNDEKSEEKSEEMMEEEKPVEEDDVQEQQELPKEQPEDTEEYKEDKEDEKDNEDKEDKGKKEDNEVKDVKEVKEDKKESKLETVVDDNKKEEEMELKKDGFSTNLAQKWKSLADDTEMEEDELSVSKPNSLKGMKTYSKKQNSAVDSETETETSEGADYRAWKKAVLVVYNRLAAHKHSSLFSRPITEDQAPGYHSVVFRPMDLSTIKKNIDNGLIRSTMQFQRDVMLMFQNAIMYNKQNTPMYKYAIDMQEECLQHMQILVTVTEEGRFKRETRTASNSSISENSDSIKRKRSLVTPSLHESDSPRFKKRRKSEND